MLPLRMLVAVAVLQLYDLRSALKRDSGAVRYVSPLFTLVVKLLASRHRESNTILLALTKWLKGEFICVLEIVWYALIW